MRDWTCYKVSRKYGGQGSDRYLVVPHILKTSCRVSLKSTDFFTTKTNEPHKSVKNSAFI